MMLNMKFFLVAVLPIVFAIGAMTMVVDVKSEKLIGEQLIRLETNILTIQSGENVDVEGMINNYRNEVTNEVEQTLTLLNWIAFFSLCVVFFSGIIININERAQANRKLKALTRRTIEFQEEERARVSRELHDGISQILVSVKYSIELGIDKIKSATGDPVQPIEKGAQSLHQAISEVRRISRDLRPTVLDDLGLGEALDSLCQEFSDRTGIRVDFTNQMDVETMSEDAKTTLYRIAQEALTNIERHSGANRARMELFEDYTSQNLIIEDNGCGFQVPRYRNINSSDVGLGVKNMMERVAYHDGEITFNSEGVNGTKIQVKLPLTLEKAA